MESQNEFVLGRLTVRIPLPVFAATAPAQIRKATPANSQHISNHRQCFFRCGKDVAHHHDDSATTTAELEIASQGRRLARQCFAVPTIHRGDWLERACAFSGVSIKSGPSRKAQTDLKEECPSEATDRWVCS